MKIALGSLLILSSIGAFSQTVTGVELSNKPLLNPTVENLPQQTLQKSILVQASGGKTSRQQVSFGKAQTRLIDVRIEPGLAFVTKMSGVCQVRLLVNDVPLKMSLRRVEGTRGERRPPPFIESDDPPQGLVTTLPIQPYPTLLEPVANPVALRAKDRVVVELKPTTKDIDCEANFVLRSTRISSPVGK
jgi:hypothetical protein